MVSDADEEGVEDQGAQVFAEVDESPGDLRSYNLQRTKL
jgi:hypothetical protein